MHPSSLKKNPPIHRASDRIVSRRSFFQRALAGGAFVCLEKSAPAQPPAPERGSGRAPSADFDSTLAFLREGYLFIPNRCNSLKSDVFETRLLLRKVTCLNGHDAAKIFYDNELFQRSNAAPKRLRRTLTGDGGVQSLDGGAHENRKAMFLSLMTPEKLGQFISILNLQLQGAGAAWAQKEKVTLFDEMQQVFFRAACTWSGVPVTDAEARNRAEDMGTMVDGFAAIGCRNLRARRARTRSEAWMGDILERVRNHEATAPQGTALHTMAWHKDENGRLLARDIAAVEMLNIVRPITAIATCVAFAALALHDHPRCAAELRGGDTEDYQSFVQEVRRYYPFTPFMLAKVRKDFDWRGVHFPAGRPVFLSAYGVNHDPRLWPNPERFDPRRFRNWDGNPFDFIPHGGGDYLSGHRCAGEQLTIQAMKAAVRFLVAYIDYDIPSQDLSFSLARVPSLPESGFVISNVRSRGKKLAAAG